MTIIDRYILRQFLQTFAICFLSMTGLYIVFDALTNLEHFRRCGAKTSGVMFFMAQYYGYHVISFFNMTNSLLALISAMFTVSWIQRNNEMTALMAAGISRARIVTPIIVAVGIVSLFAFANREFVMPNCRNELAKRPQDPMGDLPQPVIQRYDNQTDVILNGKFTYIEEKRIEEPDFTLPPILSKYGSQITAANAYYKPSNGVHPNGYLLCGVKEPKNLDSRPSLTLNDKPILITPQDAGDWLKPDEAFVCSGVSFDQLADYRSFKQFSSTIQLMSALRNPSLGLGPDVCVVIHSRLVQPLLDMTLLFLGLPLVARRENRNVFVAMGVSMVVTAAFTMTVIGMQILGEKYVLSPAQAAWGPLLIFVPIAVGISEGLRK